MEFERKIVEVGGSLMLVIPPDLARHLELKPNDPILIQDENGKNGKYASFWKKK